MKHTRSNLKDKEVGEELIIDIARYRKHPDCKQLFCFVYDPKGYVRNPRGLETDVMKLSTPELAVKVFVRK